jgi:hypothetical protein
MAPIKSSDESMDYTAQKLECYDHGIAEHIPAIIHKKVPVI